VARSVCVEAFDDPLAAIRGILDGADEALLGVAFVEHRGVNLLEPQLKTVARGRLVATTVFGSTTMQGLTAAQRGGLDVRVLNPSRGTFHPKLYIARHGDEIAAVIGSANLTSGLIANVEAGAVLRGDRSAPPLRRLWELAESWWDHVDAVTWSPERTVAVREVLAPDLLAAVTAALAANPLVRTISDAKENWVHEVTPDGVWVETAKSRALGRPAQLVEAWMIQIAWDWLQAHGSITARFLVAADGLNVKRSSFVCALLARLPGVHIASRRPIELRLRRTTSP
jgi:hypothetical protein